MKSRMYGPVAAGLVSVLSWTSALALDAAPKCESSKLSTSAKYASCRLKAESKSVKTGDPADYSKCNLDKFTSAETQAGMGVCPTEADQTTLQDYLDDCTSRAALWLAGGGGLPDACAGDLVACEGDLSTTNSDLTSCQGNLSTSNADLTSCGGDLSATNADLTSCQGNLSTTNADLTSCEGNLSTTNADLTSCEGNLSTTNADLASCEGDLSTTNADLTSCEGDLSTTNADLTSCEGDLSTTNADLTSCEGDLSTTNADLTTCEGDLAACEASVGLPETGQTATYGAGSDGDLKRGVARSFTDNGDGTITDNTTGLMWEKKSDDGSIHDKDNTYRWSIGGLSMDATLVTTFLATLNGGGGFAGYTDWRIPNVYELQSLVNFEIASPGPTVFAEFSSGCVGGCTVTTCSCTRPFRTWSSTTYRGGAANAWNVTFDDGYTFWALKTDSYYARAVRAGS